MLKQLYPLRYYSLFLLLVVLLFGFAGVRGCKLAGDDVDEKEAPGQHSRTHGRSHFYHK